MSPQAPAPAPAPPRASGAEPAPRRRLSSEECAHVLRGIAEPIRLDILALLREGPLPVHGVMQRLGLRQYQASRHLNALASLGLLQRERRSREVYFALVEAAEAASETGTIELGCCQVCIK